MKKSVNILKEIITIDLKPTNRNKFIENTHLQEFQHPIKLYFDTEFTGLSKDTTLISIGIVSCYGDVFYAEFTDYDKSKVDDWCNTNVINNLCVETPVIMHNGRVQFLKGPKNHIKTSLIIWLDMIRSLYSSGDHIQFISDVSHYDFTLLVDLISGNALNLPKYISPYCHDINQDIAMCFDTSDIEAFDLNREEIVQTLIPEYNNIYSLQISPKFSKWLSNNPCKHNALWDANIIMIISRLLNNEMDISINPNIFNELLNNKNKSNED